MYLRLFNKKNQSKGETKMVLFACIFVLAGGMILVHLDITMDIAETYLDIWDK